MTYIMTIIIGGKVQKMVGMRGMPQGGEITFAENPDERG